MTDPHSATARAAASPTDTVTTRPDESVLTAWVQEDTASLLAACDRVFGATTVAIALGSVVVWLRGGAHGLTVVLLALYPMFNLAMSQLGAHAVGRRGHVEVARIAVNVPLMTAIYALSDGPFRAMWLPLLIVVVGNVLVYPVMTRDPRTGYAVTALYLAALGVGAALRPEVAVANTVWQALALFMIGVVLTSIVAKLDATIVEARTRRHEAEAGKRALERSLRELDERNKGLRLVLDSVAQGFITVDFHGAMASERSAIVDAWFGAPHDGDTFPAFIARLDPELARWFELGFESLREEFLPAALCLDQMPKRFVAGARAFDVQYKLLERDGEPRVLLIVSDVTEHVVRERAEREQRETVTLFQRITSDRRGFDEFLREAEGHVASLAAPGDPVAERRALHTIKGNCAIYGLEGVAEVCHRVEGELAETGAPLDRAQRDTVTNAWRELTARVRRLLGERPRDVVEVEFAELARAVERAREGAPSREIAATLASWSHETLARRFERLGAYATGLSRRLGKGDLEVVVEGDGVRLDARRWAGFWSAAVHAVRNAVDHGVEAPEARAAAGKPSRPRLTFSAARRGASLEICIADDGAGIDWDAVRAKALAQGLRAESHSDLEDALFADGFSTRGEVTVTSGRGVGLAALRQAARSLGGSASLESRRGSGTTLRCVFPEFDTERLSLRPPAPPAGLASVRPMLSPASAAALS